MVAYEKRLQRGNHPLHVVESMATDHNWAFESKTDDEIVLIVTGSWTNYRVAFTWISDIEVLHLACAFEMKVPELRLSEVHHLIASINEQLWVGHFGAWIEDGMVMFRHALLLGGGIAASGQQCEAALGSALDSCERYYPAFQFVIWAGKSAREAMDAVMFDTLGKA